MTVRSTLLAAIAPVLAGATLVDALDAVTGHASDAARLALCRRLGLPTDGDRANLRQRLSTWAAERPIAEVVRELEAAARRPALPLTPAERRAAGEGGQFDRDGGAR